MVGDIGNARIFTVIVSCEEVGFFIPAEEGYGFGQIFPPAYIDLIIFPAAVATSGNRPFGEFIFGMLGDILCLRRKNDLIGVINMDGGIGPVQE